MLLGLVPGVLASVLRAHFHTILSAITTTYTLYWTLIILCTITYRISPLHPLAQYPGPLACKISKGWLAYIIARGGKAHVYVHGLHKQYGDIVRIGEFSSSICHVMSCHIMVLILNRAQ